MHRRSLRIQHKAIWEGRIEKLVVEEMLQEILLCQLPRFLQHAPTGTSTSSEGFGS